MQPYKTAQILNSRHQQKLLSGSRQTSGLEPREPEVLFHVSEQHLYFLSQATHWLLAIIRMEQERDIGVSP